MQNTSETGKKKSFLNYINVFRGLAILLIVAGHSMQIGAQNSLAHIIWCEIVCGEIGRASCREIVYAPV